jgi:hypothetical protein
MTMSVKKMGSITYDIHLLDIVREYVVLGIVGICHIVYEFLEKPVPNRYLPGKGLTTLFYAYLLYIILLLLYICDVIFYTHHTN